MNKNKKTLVILDSHAIIHRAYHALPSFTNSAGFPTGALYGVASMLIKIIEDFKPNFVVAAYDLPKPTFRHQAYDGYKGGRSKIDDDLIIQIEKSKYIFEAFNVPVISVEGFEADDVIGTLVEKYKKEKNLEIIIASGDMDTLQLIEGKNVKVFTLKKGINDTVIYDEKGVLDRYGFNPNQLVDYKGLRGDPSDNIIGVPGIGEKTATTILQKFGSIENLYKNLDKGNLKKEDGLSERIISLLKEHKEDAFFSKTLATIRRDTPINYELPNVDYISSVKEEEMLKIVSEYEFRSLMPRIRKLFSFKDPIKNEEIDEELFREVSIILWILNSDKNNLSYENILDITKKNNLKESYTWAIQELKNKKLYDIFEKIEKPLIPIIKKMEDRGIVIDENYFLSLQKSMKKRLIEIEEIIKSETGSIINLNSPKQLSNLLFVELGLKSKGKQKENGSFTTNAETLESLLGQHKIIEFILEYREIQKLLTTYVESLLSHIKEDGRVHAKFLQNGTSTGRFSSVNPNLQNIPIKSEMGKKIRHGFIASKDHLFIGSDYSQIELRVLAVLSQDSALKKTFENKEDIHSAVASRVFKVPIKDVDSEMRRKAKIINFGIIYGMGVSALQKNLGTNRVEAQNFYNEYFEAFPTIANYLEKTKDLAREYGYTETLYRRRRYFPGIKSGAPFLRAMAERMATNAPIQGTAADILKIAIKNIDEELIKNKLNEKAHLVLQIHDELIYEVEEKFIKETEDIIVRTMSEVFNFSPIEIQEKSIPLAVSVGIGSRLDELK